jgi:hypothetical protein
LQQNYLHKNIQENPTWAKPIATQKESLQKLIKQSTTQFELTIILTKYKNEKDLQTKFQFGL